MFSPTCISALVHENFVLKTPSDILLVDPFLKTNFPNITRVGVYGVAVKDNKVDIVNGVFPNGNGYTLHRVGLIYKVEQIQEINGSAEFNLQWIPIEQLEDKLVTPFVILAKQKILDK